MIDDWDWEAREMGYTDEKDMWQHLYIEEHRSIGLLALLFQTGTATISRRLDMAQIDKRPRGGDNNPGWQTYKLSHFDQRVVLSLQLDQLPELTGISRSLWYKYRRSKGAPSGLLYSISRSGTGALLVVIKSPSNSSTSEPPEVSGVLSEEEASR
jgi:hypothetical protein